MNLSQLTKKAINQKGIYFVSSRTEKIRSASSAIMKLLSNKSGVYVSTFGSYGAFLSAMKLSKINPLKIMCVDTSGAESKNTKNYRAVNSKSLTELSIIITSLMQSSKFDFLVMDSVESLLIHNEAEVVERFLSFIVNKMRYFGISCIFVCSNEKSRVSNVLLTVCDETIRV